MHDSPIPLDGSRPVPALGLRIAVLERRFRFAALLSRLSGWSIDRAWRVFRPLPAPPGPPSLPAAQLDELTPPW